MKRKLQARRPGLIGRIGGFPTALAHPPRAPYKRHRGRQVVEMISCCLMIMCRGLTAAGKHSRPCGGVMTERAGYCSD